MTCHDDDRPASLALAPAQRREIDVLIEAAGLDGREFAWAMQPNGYHPSGPPVSALVHTLTGYSFRFEFLDTAWGQNRVSVFSSRSRPNGRRAAATWDDQVSHVRAWLGRIANGEK